MSHSKDFEQLVARIHRLLEGGRAVVTWNDRMADPDNLDQQRQVDISIERNGHTTHVECRAHKAPQNVKWIEELRKACTKHIEMC